MVEKITESFENDKVADSANSDSSHAIKLSAEGNSMTKPPAKQEFSAPDQRSYINSSSETRIASPKYLADVLVQLGDAVKGGDKAVMGLVSELAQAVDANNMPNHLRDQLKFRFMDAGYDALSSTNSTLNAHTFAEHAVSQVMAALSNGKPIPEQLKTASTDYERIAAMHPPAVVGNQDAGTGDFLESMVASAIKKANRLNGGIELKFNGDLITVHPQDDASKVLDNYAQALEEKYRRRATSAEQGESHIPEIPYVKDTYARPDMTKVPFQSGSPKVWSNLLDLADKGELTRNGKRSDYAMLNQVSVVNKALQDLKEHTDRRGPELTASAIERVIDRMDKFSNSGASEWIMRRFVAATAREDVGRKVFDGILQASSQKDKPTYEEFVRGFDKRYGGETVTVRPNDHLQDVTAAALTKAQEANSRVNFEFNGVQITVFPSSDAGSLKEEYARGYEQKKQQQMLDETVKTMATAIADRKASDAHRPVLNWIDNVIKLTANNPKLKIDADSVLKTLTEAGYKVMTQDGPTNNLRTAAEHVDANLKEMHRIGEIKNLNDVPSQAYAKALIGASMAQLERTGQIDSGMQPQLKRFYDAAIKEELKKFRENREPVRNYEKQLDNDGTTRLKFTSGTPFDSAAVTTINEAKEQGRNVTMALDGEELSVSKESTLEQLRATAAEQSMQRRRDYFASDAYKEQLKQREIEKEFARAKTETLIKAMPDVFEREPGTARDAAAMQWLGEFSQVNEDAKLTPSQIKTVVEQITSAGYTTPGISEGAELVKDSNGHARWYLGQSAKVLERLGYVSESMQRYAQDYKDRFVADTTHGGTPQEEPARTQEAQRQQGVETTSQKPAPDEELGTRFNAVPDETHKPSDAKQSAQPGTGTDSLESGIEKKSAQPSIGKQTTQSRHALAGEREDKVVVRIAEGVQTAEAGEIARAVEGKDELQRVTKQALNKELFESVEKLRAMNLTFAERSWAADIIRNGAAKQLSLGIIASAITGLILSHRPTKKFDVQELKFRSAS